MHRVRTKVRIQLSISSPPTGGAARFQIPFPEKRDSEQDWRTRCVEHELFVVEGAVPAEFFQSCVHAVPHACACSTFLHEMRCRCCQHARFLNSKQDLNWIRELVWRCRACAFYCPLLSLSTAACENLVLIELFHFDFDSRGFELAEPVNSRYDLHRVSTMDD